MKISNAYPYPVLQEVGEDYINSSFLVDFNKVLPEFGELKVQATFDLNNDGIKELVKDKRAAYTIHIECPQTSYRKIHKTDNDKMDISISSHLLRGKVLIHTFIIAKERIENYKNPLLSDWYESIDITFEKGNFLAIGNAIELTLYEDHLESLNLPSIVNIQKSVSHDFMEVDIHSNNIVISLPSYEYEHYANNANSRLKNTILSMVIVPCLTEVFSKVSENRDDLESYTWYQVMEKIFKENNYNFNDVGTERLSSLKAAQLVLRKPIKTSFEEIDKLSRIED